VYSLAAVIVRALTGEPPYSGDRLAVRYARLVEPPPEPSTRVPELGSSIDVAIARGMSKDPLERPESASALLEEVAGALGIATAPVSPTVPRPVMPSRKHPSRARAAVAAATVAAALCGAVLGVGVDPLGEEARSARPEAEGIAAWKQLDSRRADLRARLAAAELPQEQGDLADQLAGAYDRAARALPIGTRAREARAARDAYAQLAAAAEAGDASEFAAASDAVTRAERQLQTRR
jgi:hypothetical protein